ncbi:hypothetical protein Ping_3104 [Psychromonas ingrahamii 37]|uniref:Uncharacterized protein n=1 Tax=Psychromonas ingrahamii (strain DSM 17664 / CCUG 51855 / 37) TaxID=357804 RepID=A1SZ86_PSYIN|nr:hypothetical protein [Psychromonas ingrahamii]ABM04801.1 hypothetical protein Ping_3104 [Psychromonas ingrahamii 37]
MEYNVWVLQSATTKTCFISTHVSFEGMTIAGFKRDIQTWNRKPDMQEELNAMAAQDDFTFDTGKVSHVDDLHEIADKMRSKSYRVLNRRIVLKKSNQKI